MKVFVYGTLKIGHNNSHLLRTAKYLGDAVTSDRYTMFCVGFPVIMPDRNGHQVAGEVYEVDAETAYNLDRLEARGRMYDRVRKYVRMVDTGKLVRLYYYVGRPDYWSIRERKVQPMQNLLQWGT